MSTSTRPGSAEDTPWHALDPDEAASRLDVQPDQGLSSDEAASRLRAHGRNEVSETEEEPWWKLLASQFTDPLIGILVVAAILAGAVGDVKDPIVIGIVLLINAGLGFYQEQRAQSGMQALREMLTFTARVRRGGDEHEIDGAELVPGDVVLLSAGSRIPADGRVIAAKGAQVDESALTGESAAVTKSAEPTESSAELAERTSVLHMNTTLVRGQATMVVTATGMDTEMGAVAAEIRDAGDDETPLQQQLGDLGTRLAFVALAACVIVLGLGLLRGDGLGRALLDAVALAVAAIPEGLPAVVTVTLALGMNTMARHGAIVKRLASVETLGSTTVICTDKTGTLTLNEMTARELVTHGRIYAITGDGYAPDGRIGDEADDLTDVRDVLLPVVLCSDAEIRDGELDGEPTEGALLVVGMKGGVDPDEARERFPRRNEIAFDSSRKYMATFHDLDGEPVVLVKGAPQVVLPWCVTFWGADGKAELDDAAVAELEQIQDDLAAEGRRVLAVASRAIDEVPGEDVEEDELEERYVGELHLQALVGIVDPPRPEAERAIEECRTAGIDVNMITGDHAATASAIAAELGIDDTAVTGSEIDDLDDEALLQAVGEAGVFARVTPQHKVRIVQGLRENGEIVAMTGDGVNDAAALKAAHIGVAMGVTGTEVAKEAAQVVLTDDNFATIVEAVRRGRAIYDNIVKFVRFQLSTNFGAIIAIIVARLIGLPAPFTPIQILWVNLIMDGPPALALGVDPPDPDIMRREPRQPGTRILPGHRIRNLLFIGSVMAAGTLVALWTGVEQQGDADLGVTLAFTTFVLYQIVNAFNAHSETDTAVRPYSLANRKLLGALATVLTLQVLVVHVGPLRTIFDTVPLTAGQWALCGGLAVLVLVAEEIRKAVARRR